MTYPRVKIGYYVKKDAQFKFLDVLAFFFK